MVATDTNQVWHPSRGIVFSPGEPDVLYPRIDLAKWFNTYARPSTTRDVFPSERLGNSDQIHADLTASEALPVLPTVPIDTENGDGTKVEVADTRLGSGDTEPPYTNLDYKICAQSFHDAKNAALGSPESFWSYTLYRGPEEDGTEKKVKVHYCKSKHTMERVCRYFLGEPVLGFDLEWVAEAHKGAGVRRNVSLIQLASPSRIALFHVALFPKDDDFVADSFRTIMEDPDISKVGVAIKADCTRLRNFLGVDTRGIFELSHLYKLVKYSASGQVGLVNKRLVPLATQVQENLNLPMFKGQDVRSSDWSRPLNMDQIVYSASDAYAGLQLYHVLDEQRERLTPCPPRPYYAELGLPIRLADGISIPTIDENVDVVDPDDSKAEKTTFSKSFNNAVKESIVLESESSTEPIAKVRTKSTIRSPRTQPQDPRVAAAESWLADYVSCIPQVLAAPSAIRAYRLWHINCDLNPPEVAKLLRNPPLQTNTVVSYILESIKLQKLPFDCSRLRDEVFTLIPKQVQEGRYKAILKVIEQEARRASAGDIVKPAAQEDSSL